MKTRILVPLIFAGALLFAQGNPQDDRLYDQVRMKLASDTVAKGGALDVAVREGVVTLRGAVATEKQKTRAAKVARKVKGVRDVVNELRIEQPVGRRG